MNQDQQLLALSYQKTLIYLGLEDIAAVFMLPEIGGGQGLNENGSGVSAVTGFLHINALCGFIEISSGEEILEGDDAPESLKAAYLNSSPEDRPEIWMGIQFSATNKLRELLEKNNLLRWDAMSEELSQGFIDSIFDAYKNR